MQHRTAHRFIAARDILTGDTVYLGQDGFWTRDPACALRIEDDMTGDLHLLDAEARGHEVTAPRLAEAI
jgi:hypothetical protein